MFLKIEMLLGKLLDQKDTNGQKNKRIIEKEKEKVKEKHGINNQTIQAELKLYYNMI
jgi:hypothetical protein